MDALVGMLADGSLLQAFWITLQPLVVGLVASVLVGVTLGVVMGLNRLAEWLGAPLFIIAQSAPLAARSEEHTSELQSLMRISYAVFCLKKKKQTDTLHTTQPT